MQIIFRRITPAANNITQLGTCSLNKNFRVFDNFISTTTSRSSFGTRTTTMTSTVNLLDLAASALASSVSASLIIRDLCRTTSSDSIGSEDSNEADARNIRFKGDGTYVTDADFAAQGFIIQAIQKVSDQVRIVGEESPDDMAEHIGKHEALVNPDTIYRLAQQEIYTRFCSSGSSSETASSPLPFSTSSPTLALPTDSDLPPLPQPCSSTKESEYIVDASRVCVFVDPLDGTKSYAHGQFESVSILIAIVLDGKPHFGIIGKPFGYDGLPSILHTGCAAVYGGSLLNDVYVAGSTINVKNGLGCSQNDGKESEEKKQLYRAVISTSRSKGLVEKFCVHLGSLGLIHPEPLLISGAGEKTFRLILRKNYEGLWFFPKPGTCLWDVAASDAILRQLGGKLTDRNGNEMDYSKTRENAENVEGVIASIDSTLHSECLRILHSGEDFGEA